MSDLSLAQVVLSAFISVVVLAIATRRGFFTLPYEEAEREYPTLILVLGAFGLYLVGGYFIPLLFLKYGQGVGFAKISWLSFITSVVILAALIGYSRVIPRPIWNDLWGRKKVRESIIFALLAWVVAFPLVVFVGQLLTGLIYLFFHTFELPDQIAIRLIKMSFHHPFLLILNGISVVCFAPIIEEILFRGFLQSYFCRFFSKYGAIGVASAFFALFHFSKQQGLGNIPLLGSLFVFSCFLGFVYERQRSLPASMMLHATFNFLSIASLYFLSD